MPRRVITGRVCGSPIVAGPFLLYAQAQDRCHRIGQTRDVHIYRLVCERTVEENILKKANQKRQLGELAIEGGGFTTDFFESMKITVSAPAEDCLGHRG